MTSLKSKTLQAREIAHWVKASTVEPDNLSSNPGSHMVGGEGPSVLPGKLRVQAAGEQALLHKAKGEIRISFYVGKEVDSG